MVRRRCRAYREQEYEIIAELSGTYPVKVLCKYMNIRRSSFYNRRKHLNHPSDKIQNLLSNIMLFEEYHAKFPSHGYRWLNAKIRLDTGLIVSDPYAHKCCKIAGIKSESKHYKYKKPGELGKTYPNLILAGLNIDGPMQCIVSDMTMFWLHGVCYELTLYMDLWNITPKQYKEQYSAVKSIAVAPVLPLFKALSRMAGIGARTYTNKCINKLLTVSSFR